MNEQNKDDLTREKGRPPWGSMKGRYDQARGE